MAVSRPVCTRTLPGLTLSSQRIVALQGRIAAGVAEQLADRDGAARTARSARRPGTGRGGGRGGSAGRTGWYSQFCFDKLTYLEHAGCGTNEWMNHSCT